MLRAALATLIILSAAVGVPPTGPETPLDTRRRLTLEEVDSGALGPQDPSYPTPNATLNPGAGEVDYLERVLSVLALVDRGAEPASRVADANKLLRYACARWAATSSGGVTGQYASSWSHRSRSLALRIWCLYSPWLAGDVQSQFTMRLNWLCANPMSGSSENIRYTNNCAYFLAHERMGQTGLASYNNVRTWLINNLKSWGQDGAHEWGTTYNAWTAGAILNLAEFAADATVKKLAEMGIDYWLARASGFCIQSRYASGAVRRYRHWLFGIATPQGTIARTLFGGTGETEKWVEWAATNYRPLNVVAARYTTAATGETRAKEREWRHRCWRGANYAIATQQNLVADYYDGTHDAVSCFVQSKVDDVRMVVPYGAHITGSTKWRSINEKAFGYRNMAVVTSGGTSRRTWTSGIAYNVPIRLFYSKFFTPMFEGGWAFLTDGTIYVAWTPTVGTPIIDPESASLANPTVVGSFLRSSWTPDAAGETSVIEVGDAPSYGSYAAFRADVISRNPNPTSSYIAKDGAVVTYTGASASVNGVAYAPSMWPRAQMAGVNGYVVGTGMSAVTFNFPAATTTGPLTRVASNMTHGAAGALPLSITTPATLPPGDAGTAYSLPLTASGGSGTYTSWVVIWGALPPGVTLAGATGVLSGTPSSAGSYSFRIRVWDSSGAFASKLFSMTVTP